MSTKQDDLNLEMKEFLSKHGSKPVSFKALDTALQGTVDAVLDGLKDAFKSHKDARRALEKRVAELEARPLPTYRGVHQDGANYTANTMVTRGGSLWFATEDTTSTPGTDGSWRLIVKRGAA
ncbi:MAG TPA: hypothetical protein VNJ03_16595 [Vicinamibacterales bacterium]|nr:hypothetical protein [Vicinamibacterales bacterium]